MKNLETRGKRRTLRSNDGHRKHGILLIWFAILGMVLIGFMALATDAGYVLYTGHELQNAADAAALAGAEMVMFDQAQAITDAVNTAAQNKAALASVQLESASDVIVGTYNRTTHAFSAGGSSPNAVKAIARRTDSSPGGPLNLIFGPIFGINTSNVSTHAIAMSNPLGPGILVLDPSAKNSLSLTGTGSDVKIAVNGGGDIIVDSNNKNAVFANGQATITATEMDVVGNQTGLPSSGLLTGGPTYINRPYVPDPLANLPEPAQGTTQANGNTTGAALSPGYYPTGISGSHTLAAGIYYIDGGISLTGGDALTATAGVMLFLKTGGISLAGQSTINYDPPTTGTYAGIAIYSARGNTSSVDLRGTSGQTNNGTIYVPSGLVDIYGTPDSTASSVIVNQLQVVGDSKLTVNYDGRYLYPRHIAYLME